ncbi:MAG: hypothetical protein K2P88_11690 [Chitinophagaceae bacterium]|uniref:hypothetical protein n=1 Tax=unclassified Paraflavitalea TaxID=2798305 RepID=UPI003D32C5D4|nr:hypothetical protein [Chitinophagaceae bacterium]
MKQPGEQESRIRGDEEGGNSERLPALRKRCDRCAAAVKKHSKYSVFSLYRKETKYATVRNEKLSEFSALRGEKKLENHQSPAMQSIKKVLHYEGLFYFKLNFSIGIKRLQFFGHRR